MKIIINYLFTKKYALNFFIILTFAISTSYNISQMDANSNEKVTSSIADWGELVNVRYSLYLDLNHTEPVEGNIDNQINYIYLSLDGSVPPDVLQIYPDASNSYLSAWIRNIVGTAIGETKNFTIPAGEGYPEGHSSGLGGIPLCFSITLLEILIEVLTTETSSIIITTTTETSSSVISNTSNQTSIEDSISDIHTETTNIQDTSSEETKNELTNLISPGFLCINLVAFILVYQRKK